MEHHGQRQLAERRGLRRIGAGPLPTPFSSGTRAGWRRSRWLRRTAGVLLQQAETNQRAVLLRDNPGGVDWVFGSHSGSGEYFLLENRQKVGYDAGLRGLRCAGLAH